MEDVYHVEISRGEFNDSQCFWAVVKGPGLPEAGDHRGSASVWELCTDITMAIQEANPGFVAPFRMVPGPDYRRQRRWPLWRRHHLFE